MKTYKRQAGLLVAVCDEELAGETIKQGDLEINISTHFYKGDLVGEEAVLQALKGSFAGNFFGKRAVSVALKAGVVSPENVKKLGDIPHAQFTILY